MGNRATANIDAVKVKHYDPGLQCDVSQVVGYRVKCSCGWKSTTHSGYTAAREALRNHRADCTSPKEVTA